MIFYSPFTDEQCTKKWKEGEGKRFNLVMFEQRKIVKLYIGMKKPQKMKALNKK
jgi:hypothetical protein